MTAGSAAFVLGVVAEARADKQTACDLAERLLVEKIDWFESENLVQLVLWQGLDASSEFLPWKDIGRLFKAAGLASPHGRFRSEPGAFDERRARKALLLLNRAAPKPAGVLFVRDTDGVVARAESLERARGARSWRFEVILATPHPKRESWVLAGFDPNNDSEREALAEARSELGFDPRDQAERLAAEGRKGKRNAKKVLESLASDYERQRACWREADLNVLRERGENSRLTRYLTEVTDRLVPLVSGVSRRA